jgi:DNA-binding NarL/FixJ family response regulator
MTKEVKVLIVEDDFYSRQWMELLLRRDWRTQVVGEVANPTELISLLHDLHRHSESVDLVIIDTEIPQDDHWLREVLEVIRIQNHEVLLLFVSVAPNLQIAQLLRQPNVAGYILKGEICHALAWAVALAAEDKKILSPGIYDLLKGDLSFPSKTLVLDGRNPVANFSPRDTEASRLAFMFSMERRDLADEMMISEDYSFGLVSSLYEKLGLNDLIRGDVRLDQIFADQPVIQFHFQQVIDFIKTRKDDEKADDTKFKLKVKDKETLAYHMLTMPLIEEINR